MRRVVPANGLKYRVPLPVREAARRLGQRSPHFRALWQARHFQLSARQPGQLERVDHMKALHGRAGLAV